jgi:hypothetical protein
LLGIMFGAFVFGYLAERRAWWPEIAGCIHLRPRARSRVQASSWSPSQLQARSLQNDRPSSAPAAGSERSTGGCHIAGCILLLLVREGSCPSTEKQNPALSRLTCMVWHTSS